MQYDVNWELPEYVEKLRRIQKHEIESNFKQNNSRKGKKFIQEKHCSDPPAISEEEIGLPAEYPEPT